MIWMVTLLLAQAAVPTQIDRGEALFYDAARGCGSCHALKGKGTAVGPDLKDISHLSPRGISMAIRSTVTQYVQIVKLKSGSSFPAMPPKDAPTVDVYDLSKMPPELHKVEKADIGVDVAEQRLETPAERAQVHAGGIGRPDLVHPVRGRE